MRAGFPGILREGVDKNAEKSGVSRTFEHPFTGPICCLPKVGGWPILRISPTFARSGLTIVYRPPKKPLNGGLERFSVAPHIAVKASIPRQFLFFARETRFLRQVKSALLLAIDLYRNFFPLAGSRVPKSIC